MSPAATREEGDYRGCAHGVAPALIIVSVPMPIVRARRASRVGLTEETIALGMMRAAPELPIFIQQRWGVLDALVVDSEWRRRGIGARLTRAVEAWALGLGAARIELNVYAFNAEARRFYEALGYLPLSTKLSKPGPGPVPRRKR